MSFHPRRLIGSGGGGDSPTRAPDNLFSTDMVEVILGISEGPIKGLKDGAKSFYVGDTTLLDTAGKSNFDDFNLTILKGNVNGQNIYPKLGGFGTSVNVNQALGQNVSVTRTGNITNIDYLDIRLLINRLVRSEDDGDQDNHTGAFKIEIRRTGTTTWFPIESPEINKKVPQSANGTDSEAYYGGAQQDRSVAVAEYDKNVIVQATQPTANSSNTNALWFQSGASNFKPYQNLAGTWTAITATRSGVVWTGSKPDGSKFNLKLTYDTTAPDNPNRGDFWVNTAGGANAAMAWNGDAWALCGSTFAPGGLDSLGAGGDVIVENGVVQITAKTTVPFVKEFRVPVARWNGTYDIRITKKTADLITESGKQAFFDLTWESFQEVKAEVWNFPGLATAQVVGRASDQFTSLPEFSGIYQGRIVRVPNTYNEVTRTFTGTWDGVTWKFAYSNNPAFVAYDLITNNRYGMAAYYPVTVNPWDVYEAAQWCDGVVNGKPRFTFNGLIQEQRLGKETINYLMGIFGGRFFDDGNGTGVIRIDKDAAPVAVFSPENVEDGKFAYSQTPLSSRYNDVTVSFINPLMDWQEDTRRVYDQSHIDTYGRTTTDLLAFGCTDPEEAIRRGRYHLASSLKEKTSVIFKTNRQGTYLTPYDIILIADDTQEFGFHGRITARTTTSITFRDPIYLEAGVSYAGSFTYPDATTGEYVTTSVNVTAGQGGVARRTLNFAATIPAGAVVDSVFAIGQVNSVFAPKPFRVMSIDEDGDDTDSVQVTAIEVFRTKWDYIDGLVNDVDDLTVAPTYTAPGKGRPLPPTDAQVNTRTYKDGGTTYRDMIVTWDKSVSKGVRHYELSWAKGKDNFNNKVIISGRKHEIADPPPGNYHFKLVAVNGKGEKSKPLFFAHKLKRGLDVPTIKNLVVNVDGRYNREGIWTPWLRVTWDPVTAEWVDEYRIKVKDQTEDHAKRYTSDDAKISIKDGIEQDKTYVVTVQALNSKGTVKKEVSTTIAVTHNTLAPATPTGWTATIGHDVITLQSDTPNTEAGFKKYKIYASEAGNTNLTLVGRSRDEKWVYREPDTIPAGQDWTRFKITAVDNHDNESGMTGYISAKKRKIKRGDKSARSDKPKSTENMLQLWDIDDDTEGSTGSDPTFDIAGTSASYSVNSTGATGRRSIRLTRSAGNAASVATWPEDRVTVEGNETYYMKARVKCVTSSGTGAIIYADFYDDAGTLLGSRSLQPGGASISLTTGWLVFEDRVLAYAGSKTVGLRAYISSTAGYTQIDVDTIIFQQANAGNRIKDGSIKGAYVKPEEIVLQRRTYKQDPVNTPPDTTVRNVIGLNIPCQSDTYTDVEYGVNIDPLSRTVNGQVRFDGTTYVQLYAAGVKVREWKVKFSKDDNSNKNVVFHYADTVKRTGNVYYEIRIYRPTGAGSEADFRQNHFRLIQAKR